MCKTRAQYHVAIRKARKDEGYIVNERFANALSINTNRDIWKAVKRIRGMTSNMLAVLLMGSLLLHILPTCLPLNVVTYIHVSLTIEDMEFIRSELNMSVKSDGYDGE